MKKDLNFIQDVNKIIKRIERLKSDLIRIRNKYNTKVKENEDFWKIPDIETNWKIPDIDTKLNIPNYDVYLLEKKESK